MLKQFYEKALPKQGVYCVSGIDKDKRTSNRFAETLDKVFEEIEKFKNKGVNTFVALGSFDGYSRKAENCIYYRSFFVDLDVGESKAYTNKEEARTALRKFLDETGLPDPVCVDSGGGMHAYWLFNEDIPIDEYLPYAKLFKTFVLDRLSADPAVMADAARIMRAPETFNYKFDPPEPTSVIGDEIPTYDFEDFKIFLGDADATPTAAAASDDVLANVSKGLDEETRLMLHMDNFVYTFDELADKSINERGCNQIKHILENAASIPEPLWWAGLSVAKFCADGATAIHKMSEDHPEYNYEDTEAKASRFPAPRTCEWFIDNFPEHCNGCEHRGKIKTPLVLGREFQVAPAVSTEDTVREDTYPTTIHTLPDLLKPFVKGANGGIYYVPPPQYDKKQKKMVTEDPALILIHDLFPVRRMHSSLDGECMLMRLVLPNDGLREFLLPMKGIYATEKLKEIISSHGVVYDPKHINNIQSYLAKWGQYMVNMYKADIMRSQMGWTEDKKGFVIGYKEITSERKTVEAAASPYVRSIARHLKPQGTFDKWQAAANELNREGLELHAFGMLCGFGSPLMHLTSTAGVTICFLGRSGSAKTGAMYAGLSVFGDPKELSIFEATDNGMTGRYLGLHNIMLGVDEIGNKDAKILSQLIHKISHGKAKIRMQASVNAEREYELSASLIAFLTTNESAYNKFESIKASPDGESARLIEFLIKKPKVLEGTGGGLLGRQIFDTFRTNYGHAGPMYVDRLFELGDSYLMDTMEFWREKFVKDFGDDSTYRFYENLIISTFTSGTVITGMNLVNLDLNRIYDKVVADMIHIREKVTKTNRTDYESLLNDYIFKKMDRLLVMHEGRVKLEPRNPMVARIEVDNSMLYVSKSDFKDYLQTLKISPREFEDAMKEKNILIDDARMRLATGYKTAMGAFNVQSYHFKTKIPEDLLDDTESDS